MQGLIKEYLHWSNEMVAYFRTCSGHGSLLRAWRNGTLPKEGWVDQERGVYYIFHGVGCTLEVGDHVLNFDFGPNGDVVGFDLWRLQEFLESRVDKYPSLSTKESQEIAFRELIDLNIVRKSSFPPTSHLYEFV